MIKSFKLFSNICIFRCGPQDVPYDRQLFISILTLDLLFSILHLWMFIDFLPALFYTILLQSIFALLIWALLNFKNQGLRFPQTIISLWGVDIIITIMAVAISLLEMLLGSNTEHLFMSIIWIAFVIWAITVKGHILRQALNISWFFATLIAMALLLINNAILNLLIKSGVF